MAIPIKIVDEKLKEVYSFVEKELPEDARASLIEACELAEEYGDNDDYKLIENLLKAEGVCTLLDLRVYGTNEEKETFKKGLKAVNR